MNDVAAYAEVSEHISTDNVIAQHSDLVKKIAYHIHSRLPSSVQISDLLQAGMIGLLEAAKNYRYDKGCSFTTFASIRIRGAIIDDIRRGDWIPRSVYKNSRAVSQAIHQLEHELGRMPLDHEVAKKLDVDMEQYHLMLRDSGSCELFCFEDYESTMTSETTEDNPSEQIDRAELKNSLMDHLKALPEKESLVLSLHYIEEMNLKDIGTIIGVSESRVSQLHGQALSRVRAKMLNSLN